MIGELPSTDTKGKDRMPNCASIHGQGQRLHELACPNVHTTAPNVAQPPCSSEGRIVPSSIAVQIREPKRISIRCHENTVDQERM